MFFCCKKSKAETNQIFLKDMVVEMFIGVFDAEKLKKQKVRINIIAETTSWPNGSEKLEDTVSYDIFVKHVRDITNSDHVYLAETVAERIATACLSEKQIKKITVRVEKLEIYPFAIPGVEIVRVKR